MQRKINRTEIQNIYQSKTKPLCTQGYGLKTSETLHTTMETCKNMLGHKPASKDMLKKTQINKKK